VRVICATHRDLKEEIRNGRFREDLFFRLHVFTIQLPPLKERREDIPLLVHHFIEKFNGETGKRVQGVAPSALAVLQSYPWPGNIRELRNTVERAMILVDGEVISEDHLPPDMHPSRAEAAVIRMPLGVPMDQIEKEYILASLQKNGGNKARTAEILGISEKTLYNKLNRYAADARSRAEAEASSRGETPPPVAAGGLKH
jgi:DNA-binding NtrC family response regulator